MSVVSIEELKERSATWTLNDGRVTHEYTRTWQVLTNNDGDGSLEIINAMNSTEGIYLGAYYSANGGTELDSFAYVTSISPQCVSEDGLQWTVSVNYGRYDPQYNNINPLADQPKVTWEFAQFTKPADQDINGSPLVNTAGSPFDPPIEVDQSRPILRIQRNEADTNTIGGGGYPQYHASWAYLYKDKVNSDTFAGADPHCVKVSNISAERDYDQVLGPYWHVSYEFAFDLTNWHAKPLNAGLMRLDTDPETGDPIQVPILLKNAYATEPVPLDDSGQPIPPPVDQSSVVYLDFEVYDELDFSVFGFDPSLFGV